MKFRVSCYSGKVITTDIHESSLLESLKAYANSHYEYIDPIGIQITPDLSNLEQKGFNVSIRPIFFGKPLKDSPNYSPSYVLDDGQGKEIYRTLYDDMSFVMQIIPASEMDDVFLIEDDNSALAWREVWIDDKGELYPFANGVKFNGQVLMHYTSGDESSLNHKAVELKNYLQQNRKYAFLNKDIAEVIGYSKAGLAHVEDLEVRKDEAED